MSSFAKLLVKGPDAASVLDRLISNQVPEVGCTSYTAILNERGGYESDCTVTNIGPDEFMIVTGSAQAVRDRDVIERAIVAVGDNVRCQVTDVTAMFAMLAVMGPRSRELLQRVSTADFSNAAFPFGASREIDVGYATVRATRLTYVGELGWELYVPVEFAVGVYEVIMRAGADLGVVNAGYYAIESLRLEKGYRAWGRELTPDINPYEAGLAFAVRFDKAADFRGKPALQLLRAGGGAGTAARRIVSLVVDAPHTNLWGGELVLRNNASVGFVTSAAFGHTVGKPVALALISNPTGAANGEWIDAGRFEIDLAGERYPATASIKSPYDPASYRTKN